MAYNRIIFSKGTTQYIDLDISFKPNPNTGDLRIKTDLESIKQSLKTLLFTNYGERPFRPRMGGNLSKLLFEPLDPITKTMLEDSIRSTITNYEPRISIINLTVSEDEADSNTLNISLTFSMVNVSAPQRVNIILKRSR